MVIYLFFANPINLAIYKVYAIYISSDDGRVPDVLDNRNRQSVVGKLPLDSPPLFHFHLSSCAVYNLPFIFFDALSMNKYFEFTMTVALAI